MLRKKLQMGANAIVFGFCTRAIGFPEDKIRPDPRIFLQLFQQPVPYDSRREKRLWVRGNAAAKPVPKIIPLDIEFLYPFAETAIGVASEGNERTGFFVYRLELLIERPIRICCMGGKDDGLFAEFTVESAEPEDPDGLGKRQPKISGRIYPYGLLPL
ncbi:hypothetical protein [Flavobacterium sp. N1718]|uniref:hypothetical protein n=1 Tax=Flavobacterium sp. N1718 TaxID=2986822 RepID=UPI0039B38E4A